MVSLERRELVMKLMQVEFILNNFELYEEHLSGTKSHKHFMDSISTDYIRAYRGGHSKLDSPEEIKVLNKLLEYFKEEQEFRRCDQLQRILSGETLNVKYAF